MVRGKQRVIVLLAMFLLTGSLIAVGPGFAKAKFVDVNESYWASEEISFLVEKGVIGGYKDQTFRPGENITRGQAVIMIARAFKLDGSKYKDPGLKDVGKTSPYYLPVKALIGEGILTEVITESKLLPSKSLTRGEMASIVAKAYKLEGNYKGQFKDVGKTHFAYDDINLLAANNITIGFADKTFRPNKPLTRVEFSVFLARAIDDRFKTPSDDEKSVSLPKVDLVGLDTDNPHYWTTNQAHVALGGKGGVFSQIKDYVQPGMEFLAWKVSEKPINLSEMMGKPGMIDTIGRNSAIINHISSEEISDPKRYVTVIFYDKDKKPLAYQENVITLKPAIITQTSADKIDGNGIFKVDNSRGVYFISTNLPANYKTLGSYYSLHGSYSEFTYNDAISAKGDRIFKINDSFGLSAVAITNFKETNKDGKFYITLVIYDQNLKPVAYVKEELNLN